MWKINKEKLPQWANEKIKTLYFNPKIANVGICQMKNSWVVINTKKKSFTFKSRKDLLEKLKNETEIYI